MQTCLFYVFSQVERDLTGQLLLHPRELVSRTHQTLTRVKPLQPKGSSFEGNDKDYLRLRIGDTKMIPAVQDALLDMKVGGVRCGLCACPVSF